MTLQQWSRYSLATQLANIYVELGRADRFDQQVDQASRERSIDRALELVNLTIQAHVGLARRRELARLREVIADTYSNATTYHVPLHRIRALLQPFAFWAARERGLA